MRRIHLFFVLLMTAISALAQNAGKVAQVVPAGFIVHGAATTEAKPADPLAWNDILRTNDHGRMRIALDDGSMLSVGAKSELRIVKHDTTSNQTLIEMLYGKARANVVPIKRTGGSFQVRTPTAVIGVLGTTVEIETVGSSTTLTGEVIENLPASRQNIADLAQLAPGAIPSKTDPDKPTIADFAPVDGTIVYGLERITGVRSIDPDIIKTVFLLPGQYTFVRRGMPPTDPQFGTPDQPRQPQQASTGTPGFGQTGGCPSFTDLRRLTESFPQGQQPSFEITGRGTSTGQVFDVNIKNPTNCPLNILVPTGAVLKPTGYAGRLVKGLILGSGMPPLKDFQLMLAEGGFGEAPVASGLSRTNFNFFVPPETGETVFTLRGYCLELHKLAPHAKTKYKFADADEAQRLSAPNLKIMETANKLFFTGQVRSQMSSLDSIVQWSLWASREKLDAKEFREQFTNLVKKNYENQKKKFDKDAKSNTEATAQDLWGAVEKVLAAVR